MFNTKIKNKGTGILLYGITPPKSNNSEDRLKEIAEKAVERIQKLNIDGLIIYDLQDESSRNSNERPYPFLPCIDASIYADRYLEKLILPKIVYCSVGKLSDNELRLKISDLAPNNAMVFVGAPSNTQPTKLHLTEAFNIWQSAPQNSLLGAVTIPERHSFKKDEHLKILRKSDNGCSFFITQCVYNIEYVKNLASDLYYFCLVNQQDIPTLIFTLTTCGSLKTLNFLDWLGIHVPDWLKNELNHCHDILSKSIILCEYIAKEIIDFCIERNIPFGLNVESVAIKKDEIEASERLLHIVNQLMIDAGVR